MNRSGETRHKGAIGKKAAKTIAILTLAAVIAAGCSSGNQEQGAETPSGSEASAIKQVKVETVEKVQISDPLEQVADVLASAQVSVIAKTSADVREVLKERGEAVQAGDVIVELDDTDALLQQKQALLGYESARQSLSSGRKQWEHNVAKMEQMVSQATKTYNKMRNDYDAGLVDKATLDQAEDAWKNARDELAMLKETSVDALELQVESSQLSVELSERALAHYKIAAPISGVLTRLDVQDGMTVGAGTPIGEIQQLDPIKVRALLTAQAANAVRSKTELQFYVPGQKTMYTGQITYLADVIDTQSNAYELNLSVGNADLSLKPGMKVQVLLTEAAEEQVVAIPTLSVVREGADNYVFVLEGDTVARRHVELGRLNGLYQEVVDGIEVGDQLVVSGQHQLKDGEQVEVVQ